MKASEVRKVYLDYFQEKGHTLVPSSSVIPHGDSTLLFTNAGMNQFKDIFTGKKVSSFRRATTAQKCIRAGGKHNDLENVGYTARHLTFFEMLGNFSFGDYFKKEAIAFAWELVTKRFGVSPDRLWITVFREDADALELWKKIAGIPDSRIAGLGEKDNFWSMGDVGPCGPCSEILLDRGEAYGPANIENGDRFFEIWNLVFMQFEQGSDGSRVPLPRPSIDTGMGLERMAMVLQGVESVFETDLFRPIIERVFELSGMPYDRGPNGVAHRVLADHIRSLVFAFADGAQPSNEGRGYVLRRILRRAARYGRKIHASGAVLHRLAEVVVREMGDAYPEIRARQEFITRLIQNEEERFGQTLDKGIELFDDVVARMRRQGTSVIPGGEVFALYDTFGFPVDLVQQMATETSFKVDMEGFEKLMGAQKERSRGASKFAESTAGTEELDVERYPQTSFLGYETTAVRTELQGAEEREGIWRVILAATPFYAESGGQVGDSGAIVGDGFLLRVEDTQKLHGRSVHRCRLVEGDPSMIRSGREVDAGVDSERRASIQRNHTATHLLHAALRKVVGTHVHQKGSLVAPDRLRFDVTHFSAFKPEELLEAEDMVRKKILDNVPVEAFEADYEEALRQGAMALFGEKYGDRVRLVRIADFSLELCGGTHVARTGDIGPFDLVGEGSVSAGVRRLEGITALGAQVQRRAEKEVLEGLSKLLKMPPEALLDRVQKLIDENRELKAQRKAPGMDRPADKAEGGVRREKLGNLLVLSATFPGADGKVLRGAYDQFKVESEEVIALFFGKAGDKLQILVAVSPQLVAKGWDARRVFEAGAARLSAKGGGRPEMVQAGGSADASAQEAALGDMLAAVRALAAGSSG